MIDDFSKKIKAEKAACLLIHGFGGNVNEVKPLADYLTAQGYIIECPSLKGHTGKRKDLKKCSYKEWIASAKESYDRLREKSDVIYLIGFSMGGLVAFQLALNNRADAVITLNTPIYFWDLKRVYMNIMDDIHTKKWDNFRRYYDSFCKLPVRALLNFRMLLYKTKPVLREVKCPVFTAQALQDDTVRMKSADYIFRTIGAENKKIKFYDGSGHLILWSRCADRVMEDVAGFLEGTL